MSPLSGSASPRCLLAGISAISQFELAEKLAGGAVMGSAVDSISHMQPLKAEAAFQRCC